MNRFNSNKIYNFNIRLAFLLISLLGISPIFAQSVNLSMLNTSKRNKLIADINNTNEKDWQRMLSILEIKLPGSLPPLLQDRKKPKEAKRKKGLIYLHDSIGRSYVRSDWGNWSNYDDSKAGVYSLPNPLKLNSGRPVKNAKVWWKKRRSEILHDYLTHIYGEIPKNIPKVKFETTKVDANILHGKVRMEQIVGHIDNSQYTKANPSINICLYLPINSKGRVPLIVQISPSYDTFFNPLMDSSNIYFPIVKEVLAQGWAFATLNPYAIQADNAAGFSKGIIGLVNKGMPRNPNQWGTLAAWSWGLSRALDYFEKDKSVNPKEIGIQGHSRWGKTALLAGALDQRWAIVFSSCSGAMGASLEKRNFGETIDNVASAKEYHWMAGNFLKYAGNWKQMPVDAHDLIALVAPRPIFITGGTLDDWSDPHGEFLACVAASPVYNLLGKKGLGTDKMPAPNVALMDGQIAFREHIGKHTDIPDWPTFLEFAQKCFQEK